MKKMIELEGTYCHHLNKPENYQVLEAYAKDKSKYTKDEKLEKFIKLFLWLVDTIRPTKAWNKPKTNKMIREIKDMLEATIVGAKRGKSSARAVANYLIDKIEHTSKLLVSQGKGRPDFNPGVPEDLDTFIAQLEAMSVAAA